jgi:hypothetical protein
VRRVGSKAMEVGGGVVIVAQHERQETATFRSLVSKQADIAVRRHLHSYYGNV